MRERAVVVALCIVAAAVLIGVYLYTHERVEIDTYHPPSGEARLNPVLAAERLLQELGYNVSSEIEFAPSFELPAGADTALVLFNYRVLQPEDLEILLDWVARGGHLIIEIQPKYGRAYDPIFTPLNIDVTVPQYELDTSLESLVSNEADDEDPTGTDDTQSPASFEGFPGRDYWGDMTLDNRRHIDFGPNDTVWTVADEDGVFAGQLAYEQGLLTVVSDLSLANNFWIGKSDHAYILTRLIGDPSDSGKVWLYYGQQFPSLASLIWQKADFLIKAGLIVLVLVLWRASGKFGPDIPRPSLARKAFLEHIAANGRFLWRKQQQAVLVSKTQESFLREFERRHPGSRHLSDSQRRRLMADICDVPEEKVDNALRQLRGRSHHDFMEKMQLLRTIWMKI